MSVENETPAVVRKSATVDKAAFSTAVRIYSHQEAIVENQYDLAILFGIGSPFAPSDPEEHLFLPHTMCFMTKEHFRDFAKLVARQVEDMDRDEDA